MKRSDIAKEYQWDLTTLFENQEAFEKQYQEARTLLLKLSEKQGSITKSKAEFVEFMNDQETFSRYLDNLSSYANMLSLIHIFAYPINPAVDMSTTSILGNCASSISILS